MADFRERPLKVKATQNLSSQDLIVAGKHGKFVLEAGYWLIESPDGEKWQVEPKVFAEIYEPCEEVL